MKFGRTWYPHVADIQMYETLFTQGINEIFVEFSQLGNDKWLSSLHQPTIEELLPCRSLVHAHVPASKLEIPLPEARLTDAQFLFCCNVYTLFSAQFFSFDKDYEASFIISLEAIRKKCLRHAHASRPQYMWVLISFILGFIILFQDLCSLLQVWKKFRFF